jgi:MoaA/NifB/PqqE/SkfB family radical SAM enzyme
MYGPIGITDKQRDYHQDFGQEEPTNFLMALMMITIYENSGKIARRNFYNGDHVNCDYRRSSIVITTALSRITREQLQPSIRAMASAG